MQRPVMAILQAFKIRPHPVRLPTRILRKFSDIVPVGIVGIDQDLRVVGGASSQSSSPWIKNSIAILVVLGVAILLLIVRIMTNVEVPFYGAVFRRKRMESGDIVVGR